MPETVSTASTTDYIATRNAAIVEKLDDAIARAAELSHNRPVSGVRPEQAAVVLLAALEAVKDSAAVAAGNDQMFEAGYLCALEIVADRLAGHLRYIEYRTK